VLPESGPTGHPQRRQGRGLTRAGILLVSESTVRGGGTRLTAVRKGRDLWLGCVFRTGGTTRWENSEVGTTKEGMEQPAILLGPVHRPRGCLFYTGRDVSGPGAVISLVGRSKFPTTIAALLRGSAA